MTQSAIEHGDKAVAAQPQIDWQQVLTEHDRWLRTVVYARVGDADAVQDVMQEIALAAVAQKAPLQDPAKVAPWLYRLALRQSLLYRRTQGRNRRKLQNYSAQAAVERPHSPPGPLDWLLADERKQMLRRALANLSQSDAEILLLKYTEGWSYGQIADHLGVSHSTVESRLHRARKRLRDKLSGV